MKAHFICGLPRAGSTLLSTLLAQNPRFHATITSPIFGIVSAIRQSISIPNEHYPIMSDDLRSRLYEGVFKSYYEQAVQSGKTIIFDSNRSWPVLLPLVSTMFPESKMIVCVRSLAWVVDSLERLFRKNQTAIPSFFNDGMEARSVYSRTDTLMRADRIVGASWNVTREGFYGEQSDRLLLLEYTYLATDPQRALRAVYDFIGEPMFEHRFTGLTMADQEDIEKFDHAMGMPGLHRVGADVRTASRATLLPPELFQRLDKMSFWRDTTGSNSTVLVGPAEVSQDARSLDPGRIR